MNPFTTILKNYWGYDQFRPMQEEIIRSVCSGRDTLGLMPTGGGKSLTFQVSSLAMEGLCLVVTPLIALMKDQVDALRQKHILATAVYSGMTQEAIVNALDKCLFGQYKFLYISPERLETELFQQYVKNLKICLLTVDEAHCISQWGYDFRPSYLNIAAIRESLPGVPVLALTATATPEVAKDIQRQLGFASENVFRTSFARKNIHYIVRRVEDKFRYLLQILQSVEGTAIVYVRNRAKTKEIADQLVENGIASESFHAGLAPREKALRQQRWMKGETRVIVSTNAFGMGIDKPDVRVVAHIDLPDSIEAYYQEAGRAGRDGENSYAVLLYGPSDRRTALKRIADNFPSEDFIRKVYAKACYYLSIAEGEGEGCSYPFDIASFCMSYRLPVFQTQSAIRMLELAGYWKYTEQNDDPSRLMIIVDKDELYNSRQLDNAQYDSLLDVILRTYSGTFIQYVHISEELIGEKLGWDRQQVYKSLTSLRQQGYVSYIPSKKTPFLTLTHYRVDEARLQLGTLDMNERKRSYEHRIKTMLDYAENRDNCRSLQILDYFGEKSTEKCGQCDVCRSKKHNGRNGRIQEIGERLIALLKQQPLSAEEIVGQSGLESETEVIAVLRTLCDIGMIIRKDNKFYAK
ncbi:MAG: RecQ family ATP-dependent DNA helicase [Paludibacteraceae bacterium]|nr:RecQ family ATP-dependent DNA helicase [Paludibacteraceae bacterium]